MSFGGLKALDARLGKMVKEVVSDEATMKIANAVGLMAKSSVTMPGRASLGGDYAFSGWKTKAGELAPLQVKYMLSTKNKGMVIIHRAPRSAGPWRVAEEGRKAQTKGEKYAAGFRHNKDGTIVQKYKKSKRTGQGSVGAFAWSYFEEIVTPKVYPLVAKELRAALGRAVIG